MSGLGRLRVLELGEMVSAAYAAKLMADLGADVIKTEEPPGDAARRRGPFPNDLPHPEKSGLFLYLNANKRSVTLDVARERQEFLRLVSWADVLLHNFPPSRMAEQGIGYRELSEHNPRLVLCSITPFGLTGPYRDYRAYEISLAHGGGWAWLSPGASTEPDQPPLKAYGHQADFQAGLAAALASLAAHYRALETGRGEHVDLSVQAAVASILEQSIPHYTYRGKVATRLGGRHLHPWGLFECEDGLILVTMPEQDQWVRLVELMGSPEWADWEIFADPYVRARNSDALSRLLNEWTRRWKVADLFRAGEERKLCFAPVFTLGELAKQEHLESRSFFAEVTHPIAGPLTVPGAPYRLNEPWWKIRRPAPLLGEHNDEVFGASQLGARATPPASSPAPSATLPLAGVRVADFTWAWAGPYCSMLLAYLGAEVIKVESRRRADLGRRLRIFPQGIEPGPNRSGFYNQWNQGKKSFLLNLRHPDAIRVAKDLIRSCDVVLESYSAGVMERIGLAYEQLREVKPDIVMASISGYGQTGPYKSYISYGNATAPLAGLSALTGYPGGPPKEVGISYGDPNGGINAAVGILAALVARKHGGSGQYVDVSLWEAMIPLIAEGWMSYAMNGVEPPRVGNRDPSFSPHNCFRCKGEDEWVTIACGTDAEWQALCAAIGTSSLAEDDRFRTAVDRKRNEDALEEILAGWTRERDKWEVTRLLQAAGVAAFPSMNAEDLLEDPQLAERGFFVRLPHPEIGVRTYTSVPWKLLGTSPATITRAPLLGEHTDTVLREILGYPKETIERLEKDGVLD